MPEKSTIVNFETVANKETSALARQSNLTHTSKVSRFVMNQEPDFKASFRKNFEEVNQQKDVIKDEIFSPRRSLPLPITHPMMQINTSRKRQYAGKHNNEHENESEDEDEKEDEHKETDIAKEHEKFGGVLKHIRDIHGQAST